MINKKEKFLSGISLGRNLTATEVTCGAAAVFQVIYGNPHDMQNDLIVVTSLREAQQRSNRSEAELNGVNPEKIETNLN
jgi:hypothetical protein